MPDIGFSEECTSGKHHACSMPVPYCRCRCHLTTQQLYEKQQQQQPIREIVIPLPEVQNTCPTCGKKAPASENFCRADGARLVRGKPCKMCHASLEPDDNFCPVCGHGQGDTPVEAEVLPPAEIIPAAKDLLQQLREYAKVQRERVDGKELSTTHALGNDSRTDSTGGSRGA